MKGDICYIQSIVQLHLSISQPLLHSHNYFRDKSIILQKNSTVPIVFQVSGKISELNFNTNLFNPVSKAVRIISVSYSLNFQCLVISHKLLLKYY